MSTLECHLTRDQFLEVEKLSLGVFKPLNGFMTSADFHSCVNDCRLKSGEVFTVPIVFDAPLSQKQEWMSCSKADLYYQKRKVAELRPQEVYSVDKVAAAKNIFGTTEMAHPGVRHFCELGDIFIGGQVEMTERPQFEFQDFELTPTETKKIFADRGWKTVVGFQTRNVPHRAHEYLQKVALETVDGILIQPLVGKKKPGDYTPEAVLKGYQALVQNYYPADRVQLAVLSTVMRYAGPREAVFHAIIRRNYGCTHFIVGRDHAGVGGYYEKYAAHKMVERFEKELGIAVLRLCGPYHCSVCDGIVTEKTCPHSQDPVVCTEISGTLMRKLISSGAQVDRRFMRPEVVEALQGIEIFIGSST